MPDVNWCSRLGAPSTWSMLVLIPLAVPMSVEALLDCRGRTDEHHSHGPACAHPKVTFAASEPS